MTVRATTARMDTLRETVTAAGVAVPAAGVDWTVHAPEPAMIVELPTAPGEPVKAGEILVRFDVASITQDINTRQLELAEAERQVAAAQTEADRIRPLFERGLAARNIMEARDSALLSAQAIRTQAKAQYDIAMLQQERTIVRARFDGVIASVWHAKGDFVTGSATDPVLRVIDPTRLQISAQVTPGEALRILPGMSATVDVVGEGRTVPASVIFIPRMNEPNALSAEIRLAIDATTTLAVDTPVRVEILLDERPDVVVVPAGCVRKDDTGSFVMIAGADGHAHRRDVQVGLATRELAQIVLGVAPGDQVITSPLDDVTDGMAITVDR